MPRKTKDPATDVVAYFETVDVATAKTVLNIVDSIVKRRGGTKAAVVKPATTKPKKPAAAGPGPVSTVGDN